ncbi:MAG: C25 family cysteine peptidase, partial [Candidatus Methylomirabilota bacterium]
KAVVTVGSGLGSPCSGTDYAATKIQGAGGTIGFTDWTGIQAVGYYVAGDPLFVKVNDVTWATCGAAPFTATVKSCTADTTIPGTCATGTVTDSVTIALTQTAVTPAPSGIFLPWVMDLTTTAGSALVGATSGSPIAAAQVGGTFYIGSGSDAGAYLITEMNGGSLTLDRALTATATSVPYSVNPPTFEDYVEGDPAPVPGADTILVVQPGQVVVAEFLDCNDGDPDATNNVKTAAALYYPSAGDTPTSSLDTRATIRGLRVDRTGVVEFATGTQQGTRGFSIFETDDRAGSALRSVTSRPVRVRTADSRVPILYRVETAPITGRYLVIEEIEAGGSRRLMGPFEIGNARLTRAFERLDAAFTASGVAPRGRAYRLERVRGALTGARGLERASAVRNWRAAQRRGGGDGVRIEVSRPGTVRIPAADLEALGVNLRTRRLNLSSLGQAVPYTIERGAAGQQLVFRATPLETDYTRARSYLLTVGTSPSMRAALTASGTPATPGFTRIERSSQYLASAPRTSDPFLWDMLWPGMAWPDPEWTVDPTGEFDLPGYQAPSDGTPVPVRIGFVSASAHGHEVSAFLNGGDGEPIGRLRMDGVGNGVLEGWIDAAALRETGNALRLVYDSNPAFDWNSDESWNDFPRFYLDWVEIGIPEPTLESPVPGEAIVLDRYDPGLPPLGGIDYLVLTHPMFREAADRIAAAKRSENLAAVVVDTDRIYDRFTAGTIEPEAIREAVRFALRESQGRLGYVLLIGDDTWDPTNRTGLGSPSFLPSLLAWNEGGGYGRIPSDHRYADVDGDGIPDVAIGRLPVSSLDEAATVAAKIERQAAVLQASAGRHLLLTDGSDPIFSRRAAAAARQLPA